ncbi:hypothetical protein BV898_12828 [Hypsibius exemplaris]|uniref:Receptor ligand binding region domain-containing protein n=1 Tax=Hypsibius exemplaris TaxID=2072580 RepID=A0A1W0WCG5_HYPEX|nr:hypothetical protein BV898_12828 [Hypsibius exemplaris]
MADRLGISNGEYVFIHVQPLQGASYGWVAQFSDPPLASLSAFRSFLFIAYRPGGNDLQEMNSALAERSLELYNNAIYNNETRPLDNFSVKSSYDIVEFFAAVVNESEKSSGFWDGRKLAQRMSNRTFNLSTGRAFVNAGRARNLDVNIFGFNTATMSLQLVGTYQYPKPRALRLEWTGSIDWPTSDRKPPPDVPVCGFSGADGPCNVQGGTSTTTTVLVVVICVLITSVGLLAGWHRRNFNQVVHNWWQLELARFQEKALLIPHTSRVTLKTVRTQDHHTN